VLGYDKALCRAANRAFTKEVSQSLKRRAKQQLGLHSVSLALTGLVAVLDLSAQTPLTMCAGRGQSVRGSHATNRPQTSLLTPGSGAGIDARPRSAEDQKDGNSESCRHANSGPSGRR
jgi:hypothetical protein